MSIYTITFSPTGGTERAAAALAAAWKEPVQSISLLKPVDASAPVTLNGDDLCILAVPAYAGRVPQLAAERLTQIAGNGAKAVLMAVFGNRDIDDTLTELQDLASAAGFVCVAGVEAVAEHSLVRQYGAGRPDEADREELKQFGIRIQEKMSSGAAAENSLSVPGNRPYKEAGKSAFHPVVTDACVECGLCVSECPAGAIPVENPKSVDETSCIACMRCEAVCPQHARKLEDAVAAGLAKRLEAGCAGRKENRLYL